MERLGVGPHAGTGFWPGELRCRLFTSDNGIRPLPRRANSLTWSALLTVGLTLIVSTLWRLRSAGSPFPGRDVLFPAHPRHPFDGASTPPSSSPCT